MGHHVTLSISGVQNSFLCSIHHTSSSDQLQQEDDPWHVMLEVGDFLSCHVRSYQPGLPTPSMLVLSQTVSSLSVVSLELGFVFPLRLASAPSSTMVAYALGHRLLTDNCQYQSYINELSPFHPISHPLTTHKMHSIAIGDGQSHDTLTPPSSRGQKPETTHSDIPLLSPLSLCMVAPSCCLLGAVMEAIIHTQ